jgi:glycosyltransferase involved in cell wall biosynthesis
MKILYLAPLNSFHTKRWISFFCNKGHDVHVLSYNAHTVGLTGAKLYLKELPKAEGFLGLSRIIGYHRVREEVRRLVKEINPDVIHVHWIDLYASGLRGLGIPIVMTTWGSDILIQAQRSPFHRWAFGRILRSADIITCDAIHLQQSLKRFRVLPEKVRIIFFGTNINEFNPEKRDPGLAEELGFPAGSKLAISLRGLEALYDVGTFIRAIPAIIQQRPDTRFVVVGDGSQRHDLETLAAELGLDGLVKFVGRLPDADLQRFTASATVYVSTSLSDGGLAASTAEAMASGVPVVITDFGNNRDWVEHGRSGFLFSLRDHESLAAHACVLLGEPEESKRIGIAGLKVIEGRNNYFTEMGKVEELYKELSHRGSRDP